jgi:glycosyltransferase involved in cell wall biosynthesis
VPGDPHVCAEDLERYQQALAERADRDAAEERTRAEQELEAEGPVFAPGHGAQYSVGVIYRGPYETEADGVCVAVRRNACALRRTGLPVFLQSESHTHSNDGLVERVTYSELPQSVRDEIGHVADLRHGKTALVIRHVVPSIANVERVARNAWLAQGTREERSAARASTVLFAAFETQTLGSETVELLGRLGGVWVPCRHNAEGLVACGLDRSKIAIIPHPMAFRDPMRTTPRSSAPRPYRFLHVGKWEPRKAQHELVEAFLSAFSPDDPVELVLKCMPFARSPGYPSTPYESIDAAFLTSYSASLWTREQALAKIRVFWNQRFDRADLARLYAECDCYVSSGRFEGFDLPAFDAKVMGLRLIYSGFGGPSDYATPSDIRIGESEWGYEIPSWYAMPVGTVWSAFGVTHLQVALVYAFRSRDDYVHAFDSSPYTLDRVGAKMRSEVDRLTSRSSTPTAGINVDGERP